MKSAAIIKPNSQNQTLRVLVPSSFDVEDRSPIAGEFLEGHSAYRLQKKLKRSTVLKGLGFSRAAKSFEVVIPSRPEPRVGGEDGENLYFFDFFAACFSRAASNTNNGGFGR